MAGIMKKLRNETERAKFEAGRALRLQREQGKLSQLQSQRKEHVSALGEAVWELYQAGQVTDARLVSICTQIRATQQEIAAQEQAIETIKLEQPPEPPSLSAMWPRCQQQRCLLPWLRRRHHSHRGGAPRRSQHASAEAVRNATNPCASVRPSAPACGARLTA
jgi:hypothetical protein